MNLIEFFNKNKFINISEFAKICGINESLMRKYAIGLHSPSKKNINLIKNGIQKIINNLNNEI